MNAKSFFTNARNQAFIAAGVLVLLTIGLVQFFFLGEKIEEQRSRATKLSIAEIIARQQNQNAFVPTSFTKPNDNQAFLRASAISNENSLAQTSEPTAQALGVTNAESIIMEELRNATKNLSLRGIIKNETQSMALFSINDTEELQTFVMGSAIGNNIIITDIRPDAVVFGKGNVQLALQMNGAATSQQ